MGQVFKGKELETLLNRSSNKKVDERLKGKRIRITKEIHREFLVNDFLYSADKRSDPMYVGFIIDGERLPFDGITELEIIEE